MIRIKKLDIFIAKQFGLLFVGTFFICQFVLMMQFLWRYVDELIGKGLSLEILAQFFWYMGLMLMPQAFPLAILLSSLITFGNLGESSELTAIKAAGISLMQTFRSLIVIVTLICGCSFYFQNVVAPDANKSFAQLLLSMKQKSPELEIPEGVFYDGIPNCNLYVQQKDLNTGKLYGIMIYRMNGGYEDAAIILADSGMLQSTAEKKHLLLTLYSGEWFENMRSQDLAGSANVPYRRETFSTKRIVLDFDGGFNLADVTGIASDARSKSLAKIRHDLDSIREFNDSVGRAYYTQAKQTVFNIPGLTKDDSVKAEKAAKKIDFDSLYLAHKPEEKQEISRIALSSIGMNAAEISMKGDYSYTLNRQLRTHQIEAIGKITLSLACIIFFFIGAPLGAIIRKGGIGTPLVISVLLFIFYYIIDNTGFKFARDGKTAVWEGVWLSSFVLLPLGVFLTYKAMRDSAVLNGDAYKNFFRRLRGLQRRELELKQYAMEDVTPARAMASLRPMLDACTEVKEQWDALPFYRKAFYTIRRFKPCDMLAERMNSLIDFLANSKNPHTIQLINNYPYKVSRRTLPVITETTRNLIDLCNNLSKNE